MKKYFLVLFFLPLSFINASSIKGVSLGDFSSCDYYLIEDNYGDYTLAQWYGGSTAYDGDILYGDLHSYGFKDLYNITMDNSTHVWIDDYLLSEDRAAEKLIDKCGWDRDIVNYFDNSSYSLSSFKKSTYVPPPPTISCPINSTLNSSDAKCYCNSGYSISANGSACVINMPACPANSSRRADNQCYCDTSFTRVGDRCISYTEKCQLTYGQNSYGTETNCYCSNGHTLNSAGNYCVLITNTNINKAATLSGDININKTTVTTDAVNTTKKATQSPELKEKEKNASVKIDVSKTKEKSQITIPTKKPSTSLKVSTTTGTSTVVKIKPQKTFWFEKIISWFK